MDTSHYSALQLRNSPDLLLLPSNLAPFAKLLPMEAAAGGQSAAVLPPASDASPASSSAVVAVNPGRLAKGVSGGTFAHIQVVPADEGDARDGVHKRMRVDVKRL